MEAKDDMGAFVNVQLEMFLRHDGIVAVASML